MTECPKCGSVKTVKNGCHLGRQRHRCKDCGFQFTRATPKGHPASEKVTAYFFVLSLFFVYFCLVCGEEMCKNGDAAAIVN